MRKFFMKSSLFAVTFAVLAFGSTPVLAVSVNEHAQAGTKTTTTGETDNSTDSSSNSQAASHKADAQAKRAEAKLKVCQNHEKAITNKMTHIADRGQKQLDLFTTIATRTETFYTNKGKILSNYDALVADVNAKQAAAQTAVDTIKSESTGFTCDGSDPKGLASSFKSSLKLEITALKHYRTSVRNLIVGVKSVQGTTASADNKTTGNQQ
jgi:hypothetical protein